MLGIVLPLLSSASWGSADFVGGLLSRRLPALTVVAVSQLTGGVTVTLVAVAVAEPLPAQVWLPFLGGVVGALGLVSFYSGLAAGTMSVVAPIAACGAVLPVAYSIAIGQVPRPLVTAGLASALVGVVLASLGTGVEVDDSPPRRPRRAVAAAIGAAICFGVFLLILGRASASSPHSELWLAAAARAGSLPTLAVLLLASRTPPPWRSLRARDLAPIMGVGIADVTANTLFLFASSAGTLAVASVLASLYPIATVLLARLVLQERVGRVQGTGAALAMLGVVLVSAG
jgi:drug/metabolite transporter (DMT)-like permease